MSVFDAGGRLMCDEVACLEPGPTCNHVLNCMHENGDAPLESSTPVWVLMFKTVALPGGAGNVTPFEIEVSVGERDDYGIAPVEYWDGGFLCLIGKHDGRYAIRTAILTELHSIEANGQLPCTGPFHDTRFDHLYKGPNMQRARLVDSYYRHYMGVCQPCRARNMSPSATMADL